MIRSFIPQRRGKRILLAVLLPAFLIAGLIARVDSAFAYGPDPYAGSGDGFSNIMPINDVARPSWGYGSIASFQYNGRTYVTYRVEDMATDGHVVSIERNISWVDNGYRIMATSSGSRKSVTLSYTSMIGRYITVRIHRSGGDTTDYIGKIYLW